MGILIQFGKLVAFGASAGLVGAVAYATYDMLTEIANKARKKT
jgi:hypothetical protein